jgi:hypothetical protein
MPALGDDSARQGDPSSTHERWKITRAGGRRNSRFAQREDQGRPGDTDTMEVISLPRLPVIRTNRTYLVDQARIHATWKRLIYRIRIANMDVCEREGY